MAQTALWNVHQNVNLIPVKTQMEGALASQAGREIIVHQV